MSVKVFFAFGVGHRIQQAAISAAKNYRSTKKNTGIQFRAKAIRYV